MFHGLAFANGWGSQSNPLCNALPGITRSTVPLGWLILSLSSQPFLRSLNLIAVSELGLIFGYVQQLSKYLSRGGLAVAHKRFYRFLYFTNQWYRMVSIQ